MSTYFTQLADEIAEASHRGQTRWGKEPYINHPRRVAAAIGEGDHDLIAAALLHDVVEDTTTTLNDLRVAGFSERVVRIVDCLTRREGESYRDFILRCAGDRDATRIKIADIEDNLVGQDRIHLKERYELALVALRAASALHDSYEEWIGDELRVIRGVGKSDIIPTMEEA